MVNDNIITSDYINDEDMEIINKVEKVKRQLNTAFKIESIIEFIKETIEESEIVDYRSHRSKKHISTVLPAFNLKIDKAKAHEKYPTWNFRDRDEEVEYVSQIIYGEIIGVFSDKMYEEIVKYNREDGSNEELFKDDNDEEIFKILLFTNIFGFKVDIDNYAFILEYFK